MILRADKGNATVVMDSEEYNSKLETMLKDAKTYEQLKKDPAKSCETNLKKLLSGMKDRLDDNTYRHLSTTDGNTPRLYGVPKIHKANIPLRPIVSYVGSPTYHLSKYLVKIISPLVGNSEQHLKNSKEWVELSRNLKLTSDEELVSFDVVSLFTSIPTDVAVTAANERLQQDPNLHDRTRLTTPDIVSLLSFCLNSTEFSFRNKFYRQKHGTAMGSPISVAVANLVMEVLESKALATFTEPPRIFKRYVDDTICIIKKKHVDAFREHLSKQDEENISFTMERYSENGLPFLDTLNTVSDDGTIKISIYRKPTHTDRYLDFTSHHPPTHKAAVVRTLIHRKETLLQDENVKQAEQKHLNTALLNNGYPPNFIKRHSKLHKKDETAVEEESQSKGFAILPYVKGVTERIRKVLADNNIKCCMKPEVTLRNILSHPKDRVMPDKKSGIVYSIPCGECNIKYIGETGRSLKTRKNEHASAVKTFNTKKSALAEHVNRTGHAINWTETKIVANEEKYHQRKWLEACKIAGEKDVLFNRDRGRTLPGNYLCLLNH